MSEGVSWVASRGSEIDVLAQVAGKEKRNVAIMNTLCH